MIQCRLIPACRFLYSNEGLLDGHGVKEDEDVKLGRRRQHNLAKLSLRLVFGLAMPFYCGLSY